MLRKLMLAGATLALLTTGAAWAQMPMPSISLGHDKPAMTPEERARQEAIDKAYKAGLGKIPPKKSVSNDPWADVRQTPTTRSSKGH